MKTQNVSVLYLHALTPVHAGTGQVSASVVDLPIAREKATNWPVLPATSLKGVLRDAAVRNSLPPGDLDALFGSQDKAGTLQFGDARLLCFPVRSWQGVFAYVTCRLALCRLKRDFTALGALLPFTQEVTNPGEEEAFVTNNSVLVESGKTELWLEDLQLTANTNSQVQAIAEGIANAVFPEDNERKNFTARFAVLPDQLFDFLAENATEITARIKIQDDTKTVQKGGLWYEEAVPAEAIFVAPVLGGNVPIDDKTVLQIGGDESVGRGLCRVTVAKNV